MQREYHFIDRYFCAQAQFEETPKAIATKATWSQEWLHLRSYLFPFFGF